MGFLGLRRPRWKHADPDVRLRAVGDLPEHAQSTFASLALADPDPRVRASCARRLSDAAALKHVQIEGDEAVRRIARERISTSAGRALKAGTMAASAQTIASIQDQKTLSELVLGAQDAAVRAAALERLLALPEPSQAILGIIAIQDASGVHALRALEAIERRATVKDVARKAKDERVRARAGARLTEAVVADERPSPERQRRARAEAAAVLIDRATRLAVAADAVASASELPALQERWASAMALAQGQPIEPELALGAERWTRLTSEVERAANRERERRAEAVQARERLLAEAEAAAPDAARSLRERWGVAPALPAELLSPLQERWDQALARSNATAAAAAATATLVEAPLAEADAAALEALSIEAEALSSTDAFHDAMPRWHALHKRWMTVSGALPDGDRRKARFLAAYAAFKNHRRDARDARTQLRQEALARVRTLVTDAEALARDAAGVGGDQELILELGARVRRLQTQWKAAAQAAGGPARAFRAAFHAACDAAYGPVAQEREAEDWMRLRNLAQAEELTATVDALAAQEDLGAVLDGVKSAHRAWKQLGPLPRDRHQPTWLVFKSACDRQFERCRPFLAAEDARTADGLARKRAMAAEATALADAATVGLSGSPADRAARRDALERIKAMQQEWRVIGFLRADEDRALARDFRAACDRVWARAREQDQERRLEQTANLERKNAIISQAESFAASAEAARSGKTGLLTAGDIARQARTLGEQFRAIGHVPREAIDEVRARFAAASDRVWATIKDERDAAAAAENANLEQKQALIKEIEEILAGENPRWFKDEVKSLTAKWRAIGEVPREREDEVERRFDALTRQVLKSR